MKIETIYFMKRTNLGNYEHIEASSSAKIEEGEDVEVAFQNLKNLVISALTDKVVEIEKEEVIAEVPPKSEEVVAPVKEEKKAKASKTKAKTETKEEVKTEAAVEEKVETKSLAIKYVRTLDAHKSFLSSYLTNTFPNWKTVKPKEEIIAFNASLEGKDFLDENGNIVDSFKKVLSGFYA